MRQLPTGGLSSTGPPLHGPGHEPQHSSEPWAHRFCVRLGDAVPDPRGHGNSDVQRAEVYGRTPGFNGLPKRPLPDLLACLHRNEPGVRVVELRGAPDIRVIRGGATGILAM